MTTRRRNIRTQTEQELAELEATERAVGTQVQQAEAPPVREVTHTESRTAVPPAQTTAVQMIPRAAQEERHEEEWEDSRAHLVKHRRPRAEEEEEQFESVYKRETYYIDRSYLPKLKKLIKKLDHTKTAVMNEALEDIFAKYGVE
jgi:hypothetical protein